jgi:hypothetical protein
MTAPFKLLGDVLAFFGYLFGPDDETESDNE